MDFKNMSDSELASVMVNYINRVAHLRDVIAQYLDKFGHCNISPDTIKDEYKELKNELREDAKYLDLNRNQNGSKLYMHIFSPSICETSACGFTVPVNHRIDQQMFGAVDDAYDNLTKYYTLEQWVELM